MSCQPMDLIDKCGNTVATLNVQRLGDHYEGEISLDTIPPKLRHLFEQFEEIVEGQMFSMLDDIEEQMETYSLRIRWIDGKESEIDELQVYPSTRAISFKTCQSKNTRSQGKDSTVGPNRSTTFT